LYKNLPQEDDVWQADFRQFPNWIRIAGEPVRPWMVLVTSPINDLILANQTSDEMPTAALLWDTLVQAMQYPAAGEPHRPTEIQVKAEERWEGLQPHLEEIGVEVVLSEDLDQLDGVFRHMTEHVCGKPQTGLLDVPGMTPEKVGSFYQAAAAFFGQAPWKKIGYESAIKVECAKYHSGPWYAILMGLSGITAGLAVYDDLEMPQRMWARDDHESGREAVGTSVTFGEEWDIPVADLEAVERFGWQVARSDAYPEVFHKDRGMSVRKPLAWELELMEGCLRAVPEFVNRRKQDDPVREEFTVPVTSGQLKLGLSWVVGNQKGSG
jgi:hypothetical protein